MCGFDDFCIDKKLQIINFEDIPAGSGKNPSYEEEFQEFKNQFQVGDIVYHYCSNDEQWENGMGVTRHPQGYMVVCSGIPQLQKPLVFQ